jgi:hypothetical protein
MTWTWWLALAVAAGLLVGCRSNTPMETAEVLMQLGVSHCLYVQGAVPPYATAYLWARFGELNTVDLAMPSALAMSVGFLPAL